MASRGRGNFSQPNDDGHLLFSVRDNEALARSYFFQIPAQVLFQFPDTNGFHVFFPRSFVFTQCVYNLLNVVTFVNLILQDSKLCL